MFPREFTRPIRTIPEPKSPIEWAVLHAQRDHTCVLPDKIYALIREDQDEIERILNTEFEDGYQAWCLLNEREAAYYAAPPMSDYDGDEF